MFRCTEGLIRTRLGLCPKEGAVSLQETSVVPKLCLPATFPFARSILFVKGGETGTQVAVT